MKIYTREELWAMHGKEFGDFYANMRSWSEVVLGEILAADTILDFILLIQSKMLVMKVVGMNRLRESELMGLEASAALFRSS